MNERRRRTLNIVVAMLIVSGCSHRGEEPVVRPAHATRPSGPAAPAPSPHARVERDPAGSGVLRGSDGWRLKHPASDHQIEAYATRVSGVPGTRFALKVSTSARGFRVAAYRIGAYAGGWGHLVWRSPHLPGRRQHAAVLDPVSTRTVVAPWRPDVVVDTSGWPSGYYVLRLRADSGWDAQVPYIVSSPTAVGTVALVAPVTTWQAYNRWGGYSLYDGPPGDRHAWAVSFDRPYDDAPGANDYRTAALPIVVRAERTGARLSYFANVDLNSRPHVLDGASGYLSLGHDEYWTTRMRRAVLRARAAGTNLGFLGANTMYWRIRLSDRGTGPGRLVTGYRDGAFADPARETRPSETTARFRDAPSARPENDLIGMQYECYPVDADYRVVSPRWWGFAGTGVRHGTVLAGLVGPETDRVYPDRRTPRPLQILSSTWIDCRGTPTSSQSTYYTVPSGAGVFTAGTLRWGCAHIDACEHPLGARVRRFVRRVTGNLIREFAKGPAGLRHPAKDNVDAFDLASTNTVDAS